MFSFREQVSLAQSGRQILNLPPPSLCSPLSLSSLVVLAGGRLTVVQPRQRRVLPSPPTPDGNSPMRQGPQKDHIETFRPRKVQEQCSGSPCLYGWDLAGLCSSVKLDLQSPGLGTQEPCLSSPILAAAQHPNPPILFLTDGPVFRPLFLW